jgi:putative DNA primase/helicase
VVVNLNYSKSDVEFDILKFAEKQLMSKFEKGKDGCFVTKDTYQSNLDRIAIYPKGITGAQRDEVSGNCFIAVNPKHEPYMKYGATKLLMYVYGDTKEQAKNRALRLIKDDYEDKPREDKVPLSNLNYDMFSKYLITKNTIVTIDKTLYRYSQGSYTLLDDDEMEFIIMDSLENSKISHRKEIVRYIQKNAPKKVQCTSRYILFNNGIYDIATKNMLPLDNTHVFLNKIPHNYNPKAEINKDIDNFFEDISCNNAEIKTLLIQVIGYCMYRSNKLGKFFILQGGGGNGKSTLFKLMQYVLGADNVSELSMEDLSGKYGVGAIRNKLVNLGDDIEDKFIEKVANVKKLATGETISTEEKFKNKQYFKYYGVLVFTANTVPRMSDKSDGLKRRLVIIPLEADFKNTVKADPNILEKLCTEDVAEYIISQAVIQLHEILYNKQFIKCQRVIEATEEYNRGNNPILEFLNEFNVDNQSVAACYKKYLFIISDDNCKPLSKIMFSKRVQNEGYISVDVFRDGKTQKVFKKAKS